MNVQFKDAKTNKIDEEFVNDPADRKKLRAFGKQFGSQIASEAVKLHQRLQAYPTQVPITKIMDRLRIE